VAILASVGLAGQSHGADVRQFAAKSTSNVTEDVGEVGEVLIETDTAVGNRFIRPGRYRVQHVAERNGHVIRFSPLGDIQLLYSPVEVPCSVERLDTEAGRTLLRLRVGAAQPQLVKLYVKGERAAHAF
jgi:hypothetical protein